MLGDGGVARLDHPPRLIALALARGDGVGEAPRLLQSGVQPRLALVRDPPRLVAFAHALVDDRLGLRAHGREPFVALFDHASRVVALANAPGDGVLVRLRLRERALEVRLALVSDRARVVALAEALRDDGVAFLDLVLLPFEFARHRAEVVVERTFRLLEQSVLLHHATLELVRVLLRGFDALSRVRARPRSLLPSLIEPFRGVGRRGPGAALEVAQALARRLRLRRRPLARGVGLDILRPPRLVRDASRFPRPGC